MTPSYENGLESDDYRFPEDFEYSFPESDPDGVQRLLLNLKLFLVSPLAVILNLILFFVIVCTKKIRGDPWRWFVANTSLYMVISAILELNSCLSLLYKVSTLLSRPSCYFFFFLQHIMYFMIPVTYTLTLTERFHTLRLGAINGGSFSRKQVILCLHEFHANL